MKNNLMVEWVDEVIMFLIFINMVEYLKITLEGLVTIYQRHEENNKEAEGISKEYQSNKEV
jgi:hypothetical protein